MSVIPSKRPKKNATVGAKGDADVVGSGGQFDHANSQNKKGVVNIFGYVIAVFTIFVLYKFGAFFAPIVKPYLLRLTAGASGVAANRVVPSADAAVSSSASVADASFVKPLGALPNVLTDADVGKLQPQESLVNTLGDGRLPSGLELNAAGEIVRARNCIVGLRLIERIRQRIEGGLDFRMELNLLRKNFNLPADGDASVYNSILPKKKLMFRLSALIGDCGVENAFCDLDGLEMLGNAGLSTAPPFDGVGATPPCDRAVGCIVGAMKRYFGVRRRLPANSGEFVRRVMSYNLDYASMLYALRASGRLGDAALLADIDRVLLVMGKVDAIEDAVAAQCS